VFRLLRSQCLTLALLTLLAATGLKAQPGLFITTSNFETGSAAVLAAGATDAEVNLLNLHSDSAVRYKQGRIYVINRFGQDNILVLDVNDPRTPLDQYSVGNGTNPQDIEIVSPTKAYVSRYESSEVLILNPQNGAKLDSIDLSLFADADGTPEMTQMALWGSRLYVGLQRLDRDNGFIPSGQSLLAVIDTETDALVDMDPSTAGIQAWPLSATNPNDLVVAGNLLAVSQTAGFGDLEGGIEVLDLAAGTSRGLVVSEVDLEGDITALALVNSNLGYAIVSDASFNNHVKSVNLSTGAVGPALAGHSGGFTSSLATDGERLIVPDRGSFDDPNAAGLLIYNANDGTLLAGPIATGLPPLSVAVLSDAPVITAVHQAANTEPESASLNAAYPNPFNASIAIPFTLEHADQSVELTVYDLLGRRVRKLVSQSMTAGHHIVRWNGRDAQGITVGNGSYLIELHTGLLRTSQKVMLLK
jgi:hypothetical protein